MNFTGQPDLLKVKRIFAMQTKKALLRLESDKTKKSR